MSRNGYRQAQPISKYRRANASTLGVPRLLNPTPADALPVGSPEALAAIERVKAAGKNWRGEGFTYTASRPSRRPYEVGIEEFERRKKGACDVDTSKTRTAYDTTNNC